MRYVSIEDCQKFVFPYIYSQLSDVEPSAAYESEKAGLADLKKVLELIQSDTFYPSFYDKAAYLLCSISGSQYFSNGNKRLALTTLVQFLILNEIPLKTFTDDEYQKLLFKIFPKHTWEKNTYIEEGHPLFLYNLAIIIGDRTVWGEGVDFSDLKQKIGEIFEVIYRLPELGGSAIDK